MHISHCVQCEKFPCADVMHECFRVPDVDILPEAVRVVMIAEATPQQPANYFYAKGKPLFAQTTVQALNDAGAAVSSMKGVLALGVYCTTAVKCAKTGYSIQTSTVNACSQLLEQELALFTGVKAWLLMGDVAIKAVNAIAKRAGEPRVIPPGATYKLHGGHYIFRGAPAFPSYLQAGPSFYIEKSKRRMIAEDIKAALMLAM